jgi:hypothetical protein
MAVRARLTDWWRRRRITAPRLDRIERYRSQAELPESLPRHQLAIVGTPQSPKWLVLECPCGSGHRLTVNLTGSRQPSWRVVDAETGPNVFPSIDFDGSERRCHFWIRDGRVRWSR